MGTHLSKSPLRRNGKQSRRVCSIQQAGDARNRQQPNLTKSLKLSVRKPQKPLQSRNSHLSKGPPKAEQNWIPTDAHSKSCGRLEGPWRAESPAGGSRIYRVWCKLRFSVFFIRSHLSRHLANVEQVETWNVIGAKCKDPSMGQILKNYLKTRKCWFVTLTLNIIITQPTAGHRPSVNWSISDGLEPANIELQMKGWTQMHPLR